MSHCYSLLPSNTRTRTAPGSIGNHDVGSGYVWVKYGTITYMSRYLPPNNEPIADSHGKLENLEDDLRKIIFGIDVSAKVVE